MNDNALLSSFDTDISITHQLLALMESELQALNEHDLSTLQTLLDQKHPLLSLLAQHAQQRSQLLHAHGFTADKEGLNQWIAKSPEGPSIEQKAQTLSQQLEQLKHCNQRNGQVIKNSQSSVSSVLGILRGGRTADIPNLYDNKGSTARIGQNKPLSQA